MPRVRRPIAGPTFEPEVMKTLGEVFDLEWAAICHAFEDWQQPSIEAARTSVARVTLHFAGKGVTDPELLREKLHKVMQQSYAGIPERQQVM